MSHHSPVDVHQSGAAKRRQKGGRTCSGKCLVNVGGKMCRKCFSAYDGATKLLNTLTIPCKSSRGAVYMRVALILTVTAVVY